MTLEITCENKTACTDGQAVLDWRNNKISAEQLLKKLSPRLKNIASWASNKYGIKDYADDVYQDLMIALVGDAGKKWNPSQNIGSYMAGWGWRIASSYQAKIFKEGSFDQLFDENEEDLSSANPLLLSEEIPIEDVIDEELRLKNLSQINLSALDKEIRKIEVQLQPKGTKRTYKKQTDLQRNEHLYFARLKFGLTKQEMAQALGIEHHKYVAYETGKTIRVPDLVYSKINDLNENMSARLEYSNQLLDKSMPEIINFWLNMLELNNVDSLTKIIGVSKRTLRRWQLIDNKPRYNLVMNYHLMVCDYIKKELR